MQHDNKTGTDKGQRHTVLYNRIFLIKRYLLPRAVPKDWCRPGLDRALAISILKENFGCGMVQPSLKYLEIMS